MEERGCCTIVQHRAFVELLVAQQPRCGILAAVVAATLHEEIRILVTPAVTPVPKPGSVVAEELVLLYNTPEVRWLEDACGFHSSKHLEPFNKSPRKGGVGSSEDVYKDRDECHVGIGFM